MVIMSMYRRQSTFYVSAISAILLLLTICLLPSASADQHTVVKSGSHQTALLELYTSEGCSSCPPADRWLNKLVNEQDSGLDVLALAFHVDYWDYIGWTDEYADPAYTQRQRHLARINRQSTIYTPEFFVNGVEARGTNSIVTMIQSSNNTLSELELELKLTRHDKNTAIQLNCDCRSKDAQVVQFVVFENNLSSDVERGENAGRQLRHQRVVRYLSPAIPLKPENTQTIAIESQWNSQNLGYGAIVKTTRGDYVQSIFSQPKTRQHLK